MDLTKQLLYENHPDEAEIIRSMGNGYLTVMPVYVMLEIISDAVNAVGPEDFDSEALYQAAESFSLSIDGFDFGFNKNKRTAVDYLGMYEIRAAEKDIFRIGSDWIPIVRAP